jgi:predicted transcriptional regulator of viral defense system
VSGAEKLSKLGVFRSRDARRVGVNASLLQYLCRSEQVERIGSDVYRHSSFQIPPEHEAYIVACAIFGSESYIGGLSALSYHHLIDQVVKKMWVVVEPRRYTENPGYKLIRTKADKTTGVESYQGFQIASVERSILDAYYFQKKIGGTLLALSAARTAIREGLTTYKRLYDMSASLGWEKRMLSHWENINAE